ncbi:hypothetical protein ACTXT7_010410 [Hymenolepis weldensis]
MDTMIPDLSGIAACLDNIIAADRSQQELQERVIALLQRIQEYGFRVRAEKQKAVAHASRTLTTTEKNYCLIEKGSLAIIFTVKQFHRFYY